MCNEIANAADSILINLTSNVSRNFYNKNVKE